jgi:hypothetical protein
MTNFKENINMNTLRNFEEKEIRVSKSISNNTSMRKSFNAEEYMYNLKLKLSGGDFNKKNLQFDENSNFAQFIQKEKEYLKNQTMNMQFQNLKNTNTSLNFQETISKDKDGATVNFYASALQFNSNNIDNNDNNNKYNDLNSNINLKQEFSLRNNYEDNNNTEKLIQEKENDVKNIKENFNFYSDKSNNIMNDKDNNNHNNNNSNNNLYKEVNLIPDANNFNIDNKLEKESGQKTFNVNMKASNNLNTPKMFSSSQLNNNSNNSNFNIGNFNDFNKNTSSFNIGSTKNQNQNSSTNTNLTQINNHNIGQENKQKKSKFLFSNLFLYFFFI